MKTYIKVVAIALGLLCIAEHGYGIVMHDGAKNDPTWQKEYEDLGASYGNVVALYGFDGTSWNNIGSGTVIGDGTKVLGAAHSALYNEGKVYLEYGVATGSHLVYDPGDIYLTSQVDIHPDYRGIIETPDLAVWTFNQALAGIVPAELYRGDNSALLGSTVTMVGYGVYGYPSDGWITLDGAKRGCQNEFTNIGLGSFGAGEDQLLTSFDYPGSYGYHHLGGTGGDFDSGGGCFVNVGDEESLLYVAGYVLGGVDYGYTGGTSVSAHADWIESVPEPSVITLVVLVGGGILFIRRHLLVKVKVGKR